MAISMLKIRRPLGRLIFNMGIAIPGKTVFLIETAPWCGTAATLLINPLHTNFSEGTKTYIYILCHFSTLTWHSLLKSFLKEYKDLPILHGQYHECWCSVDSRSQGISIHDIYYVEPNWYGSCMLRVKHPCVGSFNGLNPQWHMEKYG